VVPLSWSTATCTPLLGKNDIQGVIVMVDELAPSA
jgi:hypothetical protein